jgi:hypothetical protein
MIPTFSIQWKHRSDDAEHADLLNARLFSEEVAGLEVVHRYQRLRGRGGFSIAKCRLTTQGDRAELIYAEDSYGRWWPGVTRIIFTDDRRQEIQAVSWTDEGSAEPSEHATFKRIVNQEVLDEVKRLKRLGLIASRPLQPKFRADIRDAYQDKCAVTNCRIAGVLEAAHVRVKERIDDNSRENGILLRADIHALFNLGLLTLTKDGSKLELGADLKCDPTYGPL